jgi:hypothetical protein
MVLGVNFSLLQEDEIVVQLETLPRATSDGGGMVTQISHKTIPTSAAGPTTQNTL